MEANVVIRRRPTGPGKAIANGCIINGFELPNVRTVYLIHPADDVIVLQVELIITDFHYEDQQQQS